MTHVAEYGIEGVFRPRRTVRAHRPAATPRCRDARWPELAARLRALRADRRHSVRIVDADCGKGTLLLCAVRLARALGFTSIEARGIDDAPALVDRARASAADLHDPAVGITFEARDLVNALGDETEFPADIVVWHGCPARCDADRRRRVERAVACAGRALIADAPRATVAA